jgi:phosphoribosylamine-glycine ligase
VKVCVVGSGGREHALAVALGRNAEVVVTPGNAGIPGSTNERPEDIDADLFVIGPETPLVEGLADYLRGAGRLVFGPGSAGAQLEGSKTWMKGLLRAASVPTARYGAFAEVEPALAFLSDLPGPFVVKTDGLAAGKGVLVTDSYDEAAADVRAKLSGQAFGDAGRRVVIEEHLDGPELSLLCVCDGQRAVPLAPAQGPKVLEYNVRFGDPEAQVVLPRYAGNLSELLEEAASGRLESEPQFDDRAAVTVVCATEGYPLHPRTGDVIEGLDAADAIDGVLVFRAGVALDDAGRLVTAGGRVLAVTGLGDDLAAARATAYEAVSRISWPGMHYRTDIAAGAVVMEGNR